jgi:uncharacterized protein DUF4129
MKAALAAFVFAAVWLLPPAVRAEEAPVPEPAVQKAVADILSAREYRRLRRAAPAPSSTPTESTGSRPGAARERRMRSPGQPSRGSSSSALGALLGGLAGALRVVVWAALALVIVMVIVLVIRNRGRDAGPVEPPRSAIAREDGPAPTPGERPEGEFVQQALMHARAGRHREAIRQLLMGAMSVVERRGLIRYRKGLTNRDYLRAVAREPALRRALEPIVSAFDEVYFGRRGASAERFDECLREYRGAFGRGD